VGKGGHFAAWEEPELFASEVAEGFRLLRCPAEMVGLPIHASPIS
jgi:hypothetical protein